MHQYMERMPRTNKDISDYGQNSDLGNKSGSGMKVSAAINDHTVSERDFAMYSLKQGVEELGDIAKEEVSMGLTPGVITTTMYSPGFKEIWKLTSFCNC